MLKILPCLDSDELAASRRGELDIPRDSRHQPPLTLILLIRPDAFWRQID